MFSPESQVNSQTESAAFSVSLAGSGLRDQALSSFEEYMRVITGEPYQNRNTERFSDLADTMLEEMGTF